MKVLISFLSILFLLFLGSCKKDSSSPISPADSTTRIQTIKQYTDSSFTNVFLLTNFTYDASGRCLLKVSDNNIQNLHSVDSFYYSANVIKWIKYSYLLSTPSDITSYTTTYNLDSNGRAYSSSDDTPDNTQTTYFYDGSGYLLKKIDNTVYNSDTTFYTNISGNPSYINYGGSNNATQTFTDKSNFIGLENMGVLFLGKQNENLVFKTIWSINTAYSSQDLYEYTFDSQGRPKRQIEISGLQHKVFCLSYTYK